MDSMGRMEIAGLGYILTLCGIKIDLSQKMGHLGIIGLHPGCFWPTFSPNGLSVTEICPNLLGNSDAA